jgi:hypothetical protein
MPNFLLYPSAVSLGFITFNLTYRACKLSLLAKESYGQPHNW